MASRLDTSSATDWVTCIMTSRPCGVTRSPAVHLPQQPWLAGIVHSSSPRWHVSTPSAGGFGPGKPRRYHEPTSKQVEYGCAVLGKREAKSSTNRIGLVLSRERVSPPSCSDRCRRSRSDS
eukprot:scaffold3680_cov133-Isochrysis_galbana.AAC.10